MRRKVMATGFEQVTVTYGEEQFFVTRFNSFKVGPYTYTTTQRVGEKIEDTLKRAHTFLHAHADKMFVAKRNAYMERFSTVHAPKDDK